MNLGNQFTGNVQSRSKVIRVEDATLRVYISGIVSVAFGRSGRRFVMALTPAAKEAEMMVQELKEFAANQSPVMAPTSQNDLVRAASLGQVDAVMRQSATSVPDMAALIPRLNSKANQVAEQGPFNQKISIENFFKTIHGNETQTSGQMGTGCTSGRVKWYSAEKKFGFITGDDGIERFFNSNQLNGNAVEKGTRVTFELGQNSRGPLARNITLA